MKKLPLYPPSPCPYFLGALFLLFLFFQSCNHNRYRDFNPEEIVNVPEAQLKTYADTAATLQRLESYRSDRKKVDSLLYFAEALRNYKENISQIYAQMAFDLSTERNWKFPRAISAYRLALLKESKAKYNEDIEDALVDAKISKRIFNQTNWEDWKVQVYNLIGLLHFRKNEIDSARYYQNRALKKLDKIPIEDKKKKTLKGLIFHDLASTYYAEDPQKFIDFVQKSDSLYQILESNSDRARIRLNLGRVYIDQREFNKADSLIQLSLEYGELTKDVDLIIQSRQAKGYLFSLNFYNTREEKYFAAALNNFKICLAQQEENHYSTYSLMGWLYFTRWSYFNQGSDVDSTLFFYKFAIEDARKAGAINSIRSSSESIAYLCGLKNNWDKCNQVLGSTIPSFLNANYKAVVDTITNHSKAAYQRTNKVEQREIMVSASRQRQNILLLGSGVFIIAGLIFLLILQQSQQKRLQARMEALRAQINPHFFSNSLNAIESLVNLDKKKEASKYIIHFSRLSRQILSRSRDPNTSLKEELSMMKHFLELEKLRFRDKLTFEIIMAQDLNPEQIEVPGLILQPYAENAILHGIKPKSGPGHLRIEVKKENHKLICIIEDDGIGREKSAKIKAALLEQRKSMGMDITKERIQKMGKVKGQSLEIIDLLDEQGEAMGTRVVLQLPLKYRKEKTT